MEIVKDLRILKAMERRGFCKFCIGTSTFKYVEEADIEFTYKEKIYQQKYFDGCFYPFIIKK